MTTGKISLTNSSASITGAGTAFTSELNVGDFIFTTVNGINYTLGVDSIKSDRQLTVSVAFNGATAAGVSFEIITRQAMVGITAQLAADTARAIRGLNYDKQNWQQILTERGMATVNLPDGSRYSGPSWTSLVSSLNSKASLTGSTVQKFWVKSAEGDDNAAVPVSLLNRSLSTAIGALGTMAHLSKASRRNLDSELSRNLFACGATAANAQGAGVYTFNNTPFGYGAQYGICAQFSNQTTDTGAAGSGVWQHYLAMSTSGDLIYVTNVNSSYSARKLYSTSNTTTNSSGALVPASPIARIVNNVADNTRQDVTGTSDEYTQQSDYGYVNGESEGCKITKTGTGTYLITGATGLATDLWQVMDCGNGQGRIIALAAATETDQGIQVQCFKQKYTLTDDGELEINKGDLIDIPNDTWIDVRLVMPDDSVWNKSLTQMAASPSNAASITTATSSTTTTLGSSTS